MQTEQEAGTNACKWERAWYNKIITRGLLKLKCKAWVTRMVPWACPQNIAFERNFYMSIISWLSLSMAPVDPSVSQGATLDPRKPCQSLSMSRPFLSNGDFYRQTLLLLWMPHWPETLSEWCWGSSHKMLFLSLFSFHKCLTCTTVKKFSQPIFTSCFPFYPSQAIPPDTSNPVYLGICFFKDLKGQKRE